MPKLNPRNCDRCGKRITHDMWVHSNWSNNYYCRDLDACAVRAKRRKAAKEKL